MKLNFTCFHILCSSPQFSNPIFGPEWTYVNVKNKKQRAACVTHRGDVTVTSEPEGETVMHRDLEPVEEASLAPSGQQSTQRKNGASNNPHSVNVLLTLNLQGMKKTINYQTLRHIAQ